MISHKNVQFEVLFADVKTDVVIIIMCFENALNLITIAL